MSVYPAPMRMRLFLVPVVLVAEVEAGWEEIKKAEKQRRSPTEGVSRSQPAAAWGAKSC